MGAFSFGQDLLQPSDAFSHKEIAYITLADGTEIQGTIDDIDRKKGLIEEVVIRDENKKKKKFKPEEIKHMYLMPSKLSKLSNSIEAFTEVNQFNDNRLNNALFKQGYVYFENAPVKIKKKEYNMLLQLLNPDFSSKIRVYHDPNAGETSGWKVGGVQLTGGLDKSYYISKDNEVAYLIEKKEYKDEFEPLFEGCQTVYDTYLQEKDWKYFGKAIYDYTVNCQ